MTTTFPPGRKVDEFTGPRLTLDPITSAMNLEALASIAPSHPFHHCSMALLGNGGLGAIICHSYHPLFLIVGVANVP